MKGQKVTKVFAVNSGSYSDYGIVAMFSTRQLAQEFMDAVPDYGYNDIEEYDLDPPATEKIRKGYKLWCIRMLKDGSVEMVDKSEINTYNVKDAGEFTIWERTKAPAYRGNGIPNAMTGTVWARTEKQAVKIANEKRVQMIANNVWKD
jgi:hypothetical protein